MGMSTEITNDPNEAGKPVIVEGDLREFFNYAAKKTDWYAFDDVTTGPTVTRPDGPMIPVTSIGLAHAVARSMNEGGHVTRHEGGAYRLMLRHNMLVRWNVEDAAKIKREGTSGDTSRRYFDVAEGDVITIRYGDLMVTITATNGELVTRTEISPRKG